MTGPNPSRANELLLSIGGIVGHLTLGPAPMPFVEQLRARYDAFRVPPSPWVERAFSLKLTFTPAAPLRPAGHDEEIRAKPLTVDEGARALKVERWDFSARLAPAPRRAAGWTGAARCEMNPFSFDSLMRVLWSVFLPRAGGALIHACGLRLSEVGVIFPGPSGTGKTTLARKMEDPDHVLSDEMVAVHRDAAGAWRVSGSPFWGEFQRGGVSMRSWPLRAIAFLKQDGEVEMVPVTSSEAALRLLGCFVCFERDPETASRNLAIAVGLCAEVRGIEARLTREVRMPEVMAKLRPHLGPDIAVREPPASTREMISEFRAFLRKHKTYAFRPKGTSMRPYLKSGDSLFIQAVSETDLASGDILLYWTPGRTPAEDNLTCHRLVVRVPSLGGGTRVFTKGDALSAIEGFEDGRESEILGKVTAVSRDGKTWRVSGRVGNLARLFRSLVTMPIAKMAGR